MRLSDLLVYNSITLQCHDNPDADTIGSAFALYTYFRMAHVPVRMIYSGRDPISKKSLELMISELEIPIEYLPPVQAAAVYFPGLLLTVDCQPGAGNVTPFRSDEVAMIDHHPLEARDVTRFRVEPTLGSCATLVWEMLGEEHFPMGDNRKLSTALYYGLYTDTNQFSELFGTRDMDMRMSLDIDEHLIQRLHNSNLTLEELRIAGRALEHYYFDEEKHFAILRTEPCDSNVLGIISDFLLQVGEIESCIAYNETEDGYKLSVRSCLREISANELAVFITRDIGTGGGHTDKAGGFISRKLFLEHFNETGFEDYLKICLCEYMSLYRVIYSAREEVDIRKMSRYRRADDTICYVRADRLIRGEEETVTLNFPDASEDLVLHADDYLIIERSGTVHVIPEKRFQFCLEPAEEKVPARYLRKGDPILHCWTEGRALHLLEYASVCRPRSHFQVYGKQLTKNVKVFPEWNEDRYYIGQTGDFLVVDAYDLHHIYVERAQDFKDNYLEDY